MNRVLVVDDEAGMRAALEAHFLRRDWRVDTAATAHEAFEKFRRVLHPLVVTDIRMPGADGFSIMRQVRTLAPHTAVILLTAFGNVPDAVSAMKERRKLRLRISFRNSSLSWVIIRSHTYGF